MKYYHYYTLCIEDPDLTETRNFHTAEEAYADAVERSKPDPTTGKSLYHNAFRVLLDDETNEIGEPEDLNVPS